MGDCLEKGRVSLFVRGELQSDEVSLVEEHIDGCRNCLALVAMMAEQAASPPSLHAEPEGKRDSILVHLVAALARSLDKSGDAAVATRKHEKLGPYRVVGELGRGAMGIVYTGVHDATGRRAAVKTVATLNARSLAALRREIEFLREHRHPGIIDVFEDGIVEGDPWFAMQLLEGRPLSELNRSIWSDARAGGVHEAPPRKSVANGHLRDVLSTFARLCAPLAFVHRAGAVHCDLKPANVFLREDGPVVLMDFGLLSRAGGAIGRERLEIGGLRGTLPYLAPELVRGRIPDARADLYALGCMLYESLTGRPPFSATTLSGLLEAHLYAEPVAPSVRVADVPPRLDELVLALLAKQPEKRIGSADGVEDKLVSMLEAPARSRPSRSSPYLFRPRLVGRDGVVEQIDVLRGDAERGRGHVALISGESGIGKTFLASELALLASSAGFEVVTGECSALAAMRGSASPPAGEPFAPFQKLLLRAADRCRSEGDATVDALFESPRTIRLLARYEPALLHVSGVELDDLPALPPPAERERALEAMRSLLVRMTEDCPLLLVLDDLQWSDDLSLALLESLAADFPADARLLVLGLYRSEEETSAIAKLSAHRATRTIRLHRLDEGALLTMVGDFLARPPPAALVRALNENAEGNPFFVAEYLRSAALDGLLVQSAEGWHLAGELADGSAGLGQLRMPHSLQELLLQRIDRLGPGARSAAEIASVLGRALRPGTMAAIAAASEREVDGWIQEMRDRHLVERAPGGDLRFAHDTIRELTYSRMGEGRQRELHLAAARVLEGATARGAAFTERFGELAYHFQRGGALPRALEYYDQAAEQALRRSANADAVRFFRAAIDIADSNGAGVSPLRRGRWERRMGDALQGSGDLAGSKEHLLRALSCLGEPVPAGPAEMAVGISSKLAKQIVRRATSWAWAGAPQGSDSSELELARTYDRLMQVYYYRGEYTPLFFANLATLDFAERAPPSPTLAVAYANAAATAGIMPLRRAAALYFRLAESTLEKAYDPEVDSYLQVLYSYYVTGLGQWKVAAERADRVLAKATELGFRRRWEEGAGLHSNLGFGRDFDACLEWSDRMFESAVRRNDDQATCWGHLRRAEVHAARGDSSRAAASLAASERMTENLGLPEQIRALGVRAILELREGRVDEALRAAEQATRRIAATKAIHLYCVDPYARIAEVRVAALRAAPARQKRAMQKAARRACQTLGHAARVFPIAIPRHCLHEGTRLWLSGDERNARALWSRGLSAAIDLDIPYDEAMLRLRIGEANTEEDRAAEAADRDGAKAVLARLGVDPTAIGTLA